jgi:hypothetical protein
MKPLLALMLVVLSGAWAQEAPGLHARELFYTPVPEIVQPQGTDSNKKTAPKRNPLPPPTNQPAFQPTVTVTVEPAPLGLRYSVLKRNAAGKFEEVDADATFHSGDRIRVQVDTNTRGYLYIVAQGSSGTWKVLFPSAEVAGGSNLIQRGESRVVPAGDRGQFVFDQQAGTEKLFVVLSRQPESDLDKLIYSLGGEQRNDVDAPHTLLAQGSVGDDVVDRLRRQVSARDLVFEKVDSDAPGGKIEKAAYVVNPNPAPDAKLVVDLSLKHK